MFLLVSAEDIMSRLKVSCRRCREFLEIEMFVDLSGYSYIVPAKRLSKCNRVKIVIRKWVRYLFYLISRITLRIVM